MSEKKIIAIVGATGAQGNGPLRTILSDVSSEFTARPLNPSLQNFATWLARNKGRIPIK